MIRIRSTKFLLVTAIISFVALITLVGWLKYRAFLYTGLDLAIYNNVFWNTVHGHLFASSIHAPNYLGDHAEWLILPLSLIYRIAPHPVTLIFLQAVALGLAAVPICLIAKKLLPTPYSLLPLGFALLWLANPFAWNIALYEFHLLPFAIPLLLFAVYFFLEKRFTPFLICISLALLCREDVAFAVVGFSLISFFQKTRNWKRIIIPTILAALVFLIDQRVIAHFNPDAHYKYLVYYDWLRHATPKIVLLHLAQFTNLEFLIGIALPWLFLPFVRPRWLLLAALPYLQLLMTEPATSSIVFNTHYLSLMLPGLVIASVEGFAAMRAWKRSDVMRPIMPLLLIIAGVYTLFTLGPIIGAAELAIAKPSVHTDALNAALTRINADASVVSSFDPLTNLSGRPNAYSLHYSWIGKKQFGFSYYTLPVTPEYVLIDDADLVDYAAIYPGVDWIKPNYATGDDRMRKLLNDGGYGVVFRQAGVTLLKRDTRTNAFLFRTVANERPAGKEIAHPMRARLGPITLLGWNRQGTEWQLFFTAAEPVEVDDVLAVNGTPTSLGAGVYPTSEWKPDEVVAIPIQTDAEKLTLQIENVSGAFELGPTRETILKLDSKKKIGPEISIP
jgi:uncharacterized membrane protein